MNSPKQYWDRPTKSSQREKVVSKFNKINGIPFGKYYKVLFKNKT